MWQVTDTTNDRIMGEFLTEKTARIRARGLNFGRRDDRYVVRYVTVTINWGNFSATREA